MTKKLATFKIDWHVDNCNLMYFKLISGQPKGICWTHQGLWDYFALQLSTKFPTHTIVSTQTFFHIGGFWNTLAALLIGHTWCHVRLH